MATELNLSPRYAQWAVQGLARLVSTFAVLQGSLIILGGKDRWSSPGYAVAMQVPGAPATWGVALALIGAVTILFSFTHHMRLTASSLFLFCFWCACFTTASVVATFRNPLASTSFTYVFMMILGGFLAVIYWKSWALNSTLGERVRDEVREQAS